jgi:murein DD-endopeptidase MepM/ murein hydrolase activator NlpD
VSPGATLVMREEGERIVSSVERLPRMVDVRVVSGTIETSLYAAAVKNGVPEHVVSAIADILGWDIDFATALRRGDSFRVAYEDVHDGNGGRMPEGKVLAVELDAEKAFLRAVYYEAGDGGGHYYSPDGHPFGRTFLRYPVEFTRISSQFSHSRFHPVLRVRRPHLGVDFAAPMGTPVRSIAAGKVRYAGWKGANGRFVKIDHGDGLESSYSHLKRIAPGVRPGARIHMGQVIGAVGATGLATGPHLHFALYRNGVYVNPMRAALPAPPPLSAELMAGFERARDELLAQLALAPSTAPAVVASAGTVSRAN